VVALRWPRARPLAEKRSSGHSVSGHRGTAAAFWIQNGRCGVPLGRDGLTIQDCAAGHACRAQPGDTKSPTVLSGAVRAGSSAIRGCRWAGLQEDVVFLECRCRWTQTAWRGPGSGATGGDRWGERPRGRFSLGFCGSAMSSGSVTFEDVRVIEGEIPGVLCLKILIRAVKLSGEERRRALRQPCG